MTTATPQEPEVILVVDDDPDILRVVEVNLRLHGYEVLLASSGGEALALLESHRPHLALVDLMMPGMDGLELTRRLRADPMVTALPIIVLTAKALTSDKVAGLAAGADDYIVKPFDTSELLARVRATLRRNQEAREVSPLTGLPGNTRIQREIADRLRARTEFAVCYIDVDRFKSVNDAYGFARGDEFITALARSLRRATIAAGLPPAFLGHVGGDDFVVVCSPGQLKPINEKTVAHFEAAVDELYDPRDAQRGYLELIDRQGRLHQVNLVTLSIGVAISSTRPYRHPSEVSEVASEMKAVAKKHAGNWVAEDRRSRHLGLPAQRVDEQETASPRELSP